MAGELAGKVAVVTGGSNGLGLGISQLFVAEGAKVVIGDIDMAGETVAQELGENCRFLRTDVSQAEDIQALCDLAVSEFGGLHVMCNNAGVSARMSRLLDDTLDDFARIINVNLLGVIRGTQIAGRYMRDHGGGAIINVSSIAGALASFGVTSYRASKAAVLQFTKGAAIDLAEYDIRVNCIMPGQIETGILRKALALNVPADKLDEYDAAVRVIMQSYQPVRRRGRLDDVAQAALFLAGDRSTYITGIILPVDGGITAGDAHNYLEMFEEARERIVSGEA